MSLPTLFKGNFEQSWRSVNIGTDGIHHFLSIATNQQELPSDYYLTKVKKQGYLVG